MIWRGLLGKIIEEVVPRDWELSTMLIVGEILNRKAGTESRLYAAEYSHLYRKATKKRRHDFITRNLGCSEGNGGARAIPGGQARWPHLGGLDCAGGESNRAAFASRCASYRQWVLVMATGIAVRYLAELIKDKRTDPGVWCSMKVAGLRFLPAGRA